ncbi:MAG TPA: hypothetical protein VGK48_18945, partial [Terriglobia bacterium]
DIYPIRYAVVILTFLPANFSRSSTHSPTLNLRKAPLSEMKDREALHHTFRRQTNRLPDIDRK